MYKAEQEWKSTFDAIGWNFLVNEGIESRWFEGEQGGPKESFYYGDFEEFVYHRNIKIANS